MHCLTWLLRHGPVATAPPTASGLADRAEGESGSGAGVKASPRGHGWARIKKVLVTDALRSILKYLEQHS